MIYRAPFALPWLYPNLVWRIANTDKKLYLTFDDGPVPGPTNFVLDTLATYNIKATFFCIGDNIRKHPDIFKKIPEQGHAIGNHTFNHLKGWNTSLTDYVANVEQCEAIIHENLTGRQFPDAHSDRLTDSRKLFRPPYGRITRAQIKALSQYKIIMWDVLTNDYDRAKSAEACLRNSIRVTRTGSVIVFHDSVKAERNMMYALPRYVEYFLERGYTFNTLPV